MNARTFPILNCDHPGRTLRAVPWDLLEPHRGQAMQNHSQTLERLAERGGLDPTEMLAVLEDRRWFGMDIPTAESRIVELMRRHEQRAATIAAFAPTPRTADDDPKPDFAPLPQIDFTPPGPEPISGGGGSFDGGGASSDFGSGGGDP